MVKEGAVGVSVMVSIHAAKKRQIVPSLYTLPTDDFQQQSILFLLKDDSQLKSFFNGVTTYLTSAKTSFLWNFLKRP